MIAQFFKPVNTCVTLKLLSTVNSVCSRCLTKRQAKFPNLVSHHKQERCLKNYLPQDSTIMSFIKLLLVTCLQPPPLWKNQGSIPEERCGQVSAMVI